MNYLAILFVAVLFFQLGRMFESLKIALEMERLKPEIQRALRDDTF